MTRILSSFGSCFFRFESWAPQSACAQTDRFVSHFWFVGTGRLGFLFGPVNVKCDGRQTYRFDKSVHQQNMRRFVDFDIWYGIRSRRLKFRHLWGSYNLDAIFGWDRDYNYFGTSYGINDADPDYQNVFYIVNSFRCYPFILFYHNNSHKFFYAYETKRPFL